MVDIQVKERFIELRSQGISYEKIAQSLSVSKQTLINWSRENRYALANLKKLRKEALLEKLELTEKARLERLGKMLQRLQEELLKRDFSSVPTEKLSELFLKYLEYNHKIDGPIFFQTKEPHEISLLEEKKWTED